MEDANDAVYELLGYEKDEILGSNVAEFYVHRESREKFVKAVRVSGSVRDFAAKLKRKEGDREVVGAIVQTQTVEGQAGVGRRSVVHTQKPLAAQGNFLTTNAGAENMSRRSIGFSEQDKSTDAMEAINHLFTPEFRNRLDAIVQFKSLPEDIILTVVDKFLVELQGQLDDKSVTLDIDDDARWWLVEKGYDKTMGARPMARVIQEHIKKPLAEMVLFGKLAEKGGTVHVRAQGDSLALEIEEEEEALC